jgi:hypothetical protein
MLKKVDNFHFQKYSDLIGGDFIFGCNRICSCKSGYYKILRFETIAEVDAVRRFNEL